MRMPSQRRKSLPVRVLHAAAAKRQTAEAESEEGRAFEGALLLVYQGNNASLTTLKNLIAGSDDKVTSTLGEPLDYTFAQIKQILQQTASPFGDPLVAGAGLVDALAAVTAAMPPPPNAPPAGTTADMVLSNPGGVYVGLGVGALKRLLIGTAMLVGCSQHSQTAFAIWSERGYLARVQGRDGSPGLYPHLSLDRYAAMLRQVEVEDFGGLRLILKNMERIGWVKFHGEEEFRFLRPFHRVFDKCLELSAAKGGKASPTQSPQGET